MLSSSATLRAIFGSVERLAWSVAISARAATVSPASMRDIA